MFRMRDVILGLTFGVVFCGFMLSATAQDSNEKNNSLCIPTGTVVLGPPEAVESKNSLVEFPHSRHFIYNCKQCHHKWNQDAQLQTCATSNCHDLVKTPKITSDGEFAEVLAVRYYKKAFHQKCIGCHLGIKRQNIAIEKSLRFSDKDLKLQNAGPTGCIQCHPKV